MSEPTLMEAYDNLKQDYDSLLKATLDRYQAMQPIMERLYTVLQDDHYDCDIPSNEECRVMGMTDSEWQIEYHHGLMREAKQLLEKGGS